MYYFFLNWLAWLGRVNRNLVKTTVLLLRFIDLFFIINPQNYVETLVCLHQNISYYSHVYEKKKQRNKKSIFVRYRVMQEIERRKSKKKKLMLTGVREYKQLRHAIVCVRACVYAWVSPYYNRESVHGRHADPRRNIRETSGRNEWGKNMWHDKSHERFIVFRRRQRKTYAGQKTTIRYRDRRRRWQEYTDNSKTNNNNNYNIVIT